MQCGVVIQTEPFGCGDAVMDRQSDQAGNVCVSMRVLLDTGAGQATRGVDHHTLSRPFGSE